MRALLFSLAALTSAVASAAVPNSYVCSGNGVEIHYTTTSLQGRPTFSVALDGDRAAKEGQEIKQEKTVMGDVISIVQKAVPDASMTWVSLVLPLVALDEKHPNLSFETSWVKTVVRSSFLGPKELGGQVTTSKFQPITCVARSVKF